MSMALNKAGFTLELYPGNLCKHGHARAAQGLARYLSRNLFAPIKYTPSPARNSLLGRSGIVFFRNITGFNGGYGDHIDVWNGSKTKTGEYFGKCQGVWFWSL